MALVFGLEGKNRDIGIKISADIQYEKNMTDRCCFRLKNQYNGTIFRTFRKKESQQPQK